MNKTHLVAACVLCLTAISYDDEIRDTPKIVETNIQSMKKMNERKSKDWLVRWQQNILGNVANQYCTKEMGEDMGWLMFPMLKGFYYGYLATGNITWVAMFVRCADAWIERAIVEPDGYMGWPKVGAAGTNVDNLDAFYADSMLGEAMVLQYAVLMSDQILKAAPLRQKFATKATSYIELAEQTFKK